MITKKEIIEKCFKGFYATNTEMGDGSDIFTMRNEIKNRAITTVSILYLFIPNIDRTKLNIINEIKELPSIPSVYEYMKQLELLLIMHYQ